MTSMTWSGPTTPAVSSSTPSPSRLGFWAIRLSSRPSRFRCWKCWSTMTPGRTPRPAAIWAIRCLGVAPDAPNAIMWLDIADAPAEVPGHHRAVLEAIEDGVREERPADRRRQPELVAAGQEDARRVAHGKHGGLVVGLRPGDGVERSDVLDAQLAEDGPVALARLEAERGSGADDRDRRVRATGQRDEAVEDDAVADLVLRTADDDDGSIGHRPG